MQISQLSRFALVLGIITVLSALCPAPGGHNDEIWSERATSTVEILNDLDAEINDDQPNTNFGSNTTMRIGRSPGVSPATISHRAILEFDVSESNIPVGATINGARLTIVASADSEGDVAVLVSKLRRITESGWVEGEVTWSNYAVGFANAWAKPGGDYTNDLEADWFMYGGAGDPIDIGDLEALVEDAIDNRAGRFIIILMRKDECETPGFTDFHSSEAGTESNRPRLVVDYTE